MVRFNFCRLVLMFCFLINMASANEMNLAPASKMIDRQKIGEMVWPTDLSVEFNATKKGLKELSEFQSSVWEVATHNIGPIFEFWTIDSKGGTVKSESTLLFTHTLVSHVSKTMMYLFFFFGNSSSRLNIETRRKFYSELKKEYEIFKPHFASLQEIADDEFFKNDSFSSNLLKTDSENDPVPYISRIPYLAHKIFYSDSIHTKNNRTILKGVVFRIEKALERMEKFIAIVDLEYADKLEDPKAVDISA